MTFFNAKCYNVYTETEVTRMAVSDNFIPSNVSANMTPLDLPDCVHLTEQCRCDILRVKKCVGRKCTFCVSPSDRKNSENRWQSRINKIDEERQKKISAAYYGGKRPWKPGKEV